VRNYAKKKTELVGSIMARIFGARDEKKKLALRSYITRISAEASASRWQVRLLTPALRQGVRAPAGFGGGGRGRQNLRREWLAKADQSNPGNILESSEDSKWDALGSPIPTTGSGSETGSPSKGGGIGEEHRLRDKQTYLASFMIKRPKGRFFLSRGQSTYLFEGDG